MLARYCIRLYSVISSLLSLYRACANGSIVAFGGYDTLLTSHSILDEVPEPHQRYCRQRVKNHYQEVTQPVQFLFLLRLRSLTP